MYNNNNMQVPNYVLYAGILTPVFVYLGTLLHILHQVSLLSDISAFTEALLRLLLSYPSCPGVPRPPCRRRGR